MRSRRVAALLAIAVVVALADQLTKAWALSALAEGERTSLVGDLLGLVLVRNSGAAFSIATGMTWVFTIAALVVIVVVLRVAGRLRSWTWAVALGLLLGGAVGNLVDRLFREPGIARGHVVDFIAYGDWFVGNLADVGIVVAAALILLLGIANVGLDGTRHHRTADAVAEDDGVATASDDAAAAGATPTPRRGK